MALQRLSHCSATLAALANIHGEGSQEDLTFAADAARTATDPTDGGRVPNPTGLPANELYAIIDAVPRQNSARLQNQRLRGEPARRAFRYDHLMFVRLRHLLGWVVSTFRSREELLLENLALREQLLARHAKRPRPRLSSGRQAVLGSSAKSLVWLEEIIDLHGSVGNCGDGQCTLGAKWPKEPLWKKKRATFGFDELQLN